MMKTVRLSLWMALLAAGALAFVAQIVVYLIQPAFGQQTQNQSPPSRPEAVVLTLSGAVTPTMADYISREIGVASENGIEVVVLELDTPGGLVDSMKTINKAILASNTPVVTFVSPQGARSASAGLYIMYAAHISAMAPATNTGSATPIQLGGPESAPPDDDRAPGDENENDSADEVPDAADETSPVTLEDAREVIEQVRPNARREAPAPPLSNDGALRAKVINDSVGNIRALAELRGRNADWAEKAVREAANVTATEALALNVIDLIAEDLDDLLKQIDGMVVNTPAGEKTLNTDGIIVTRIVPTMIENILGFFANPNVAAILMSLGTTGIIIEMWNPGSIFPGVLGLISLLLALYSFQVLPFNWLGVAFIVAGVIFIALEAYTPTFGVIGLIGLFCFAAGLYIVFPDGFRVSGSVIISAVALAGGFLALILFALVSSRAHGPLLGSEAIRRREGRVDEWDGLEGYVIVEGERWAARSTTPLQPGDRIKVIDVDGLVLVVRRAKAESGLLGAIRGAPPVKAEPGQG